MKAHTSPSVQRNVVAAGLLLAIAISSMMGGFLLLDTMAKDQALDPTIEGESGGFILLLLWGLALYTFSFGLLALRRALQQGSAPMPLWVLLLGLLPTIWLGLTLLRFFWVDFA